MQRNQDNPLDNTDDNSLKEMNIYSQHTKNDYSRPDSVNKYPNSTHHKDKLRNKSPLSQNSVSSLSVIS